MPVWHKIVNIIAWKKKKISNASAKFKFSKNEVFLVPEKKWNLCLKHLRYSTDQWCLYFKVIDYLNISVVWGHFISEKYKE